MLAGKLTRSVGGVRIGVQRCEPCQMKRQTYSDNRQRSREAPPYPYLSVPSASVRVLFPHQNMVGGAISMVGRVDWNGSGVPLRLCTR
jgi:hypothetical protein